MNAPVVAIEGIPVGPAHAAVALHRGTHGVVDVTVAIRCARTGRVAYFTAGNELRELRSPDIVMDAALSFAESMGFLFDDEEVEIRGADGPREAARIWQQFLNADAHDTAPPGGLGASEPHMDLALVDVSESRGEVAALDGRSESHSRTEYRGIAQELGPILSPIAAGLDPAAAPGPDPIDAESHARETGPAPGRGMASSAQADELPFWLEIPDEDAPPQSARAPAREPRAGDERLATPREGGVADGEGAPASRELLHRVLAETAADRLCAPQPPPGPGLSKFRLKPSPEGAPRSETAPPREVAAEPGPEDGVERSEMRMASRAGLRESLGRSHLMLKLLSRF